LTSATIVREPVTPFGPLALLLQSTYTGYVGQQVSHVAPLSYPPLPGAEEQPAGSIHNLMLIVALDRCQSGAMNRPDPGGAGSLAVDHHHRKARGVCFDADEVPQTYRRRFPVAGSGTPRYQSSPCWPARPSGVSIS
jgi:hypothetical protein